MHPFFVNDDWVAASELTAGDRLLLFTGDKLAIDSIFTFRTDTATAVYNLEVSSNHNYYVSVSKLLVHNCVTKIPKLADDIMEWLGEGAEMKYNKAGDPYFMSKDGLRKVRWDWNKTSPHDFKHLHFEVFKNGKWKDAVKGKSQIGKW